MRDRSEIARKLPLVVEYLEKLEDTTGCDTLDELLASAAEAVGVDGV